MKVEGPKSSSELNRKKDVKKSSSGDGAFKSMMGGGTGVSSMGGAGLSAGIASIDMLLAAQSTEDPAQEKSKRRMQVRAEDILDRLNALRVAMVSGKITIGHMVSIADIVASHRENINDPALTAILDEIDLRAHVELAKLKMAKSRSV